MLTEKILPDMQMIGFLVSNDRDKVKDKAPEKLAEFDKIVDYKKFSPTTFYSIKETLLYHKTATKLIYGSESAENFHIMGGWDYNQIMGSQFGKIVRSLFVRDAKKGLLSFSKIFNSVIKGFNITTLEKSENEVEIYFGSDVLYHDSYWMGFFEAYLRDLQKEGKVSVGNIPDGRRKIVITWK